MSSHVYATVRDVTDRLGAAKVRGLADVPTAAERDLAWTALERSLADASSEIDGYVAVRHTLPLAPVPAVLVRLCVDLAVQLRSSGSALATEDKRRRADRVRELLRDIAAGKISLGSADPDPPASQASPAVTMRSQPRVMTRTSLRGIL